MANSHFSQLLKAERVREKGSPTFHCPKDSEGADGFMVIHGANINFDADGNFVNIMDAGWIEQMVVAAARKQGINRPRYFKPGAEAKLAFD